jgi:hypothetical protein
MIKRSGKVLKKLRISILGLFLCAFLSGIVTVAFAAAPTPVSISKSRVIKVIDRTKVISPKQLAVPKIVISKNKITVPTSLMNRMNKITLMKNPPRPGLVSKNTMD